MRKSLKEIANEFGIVRSFNNGAWIPTIPDWDYVLNIPEFEELSNKNTVSRWHQEKNMLVHTRMVCKEMQTIIRKSNKETSARFSDDEMLVLMLAALFHDLGKCKCANNEEGKLLSNGHPEISEKLCRKILWNMDILWRERICEIVRWHDLYCSSDISERKLATKLSQLSPWLYVHIDLLYAMFRADDRGSIKPDELFGSSEKMISKIENVLKTKQFHIFVPIKNFGEFIVYIMCGLPGSGKSTWCSENLPGVPVVSRDLIREELGMTPVGVKYMGTPEQEDLVSKISAERVEKFCKYKQSFIYDNMNSREKYRKQFLESIRKYHPIVRFVYLEVDDLSVLEGRRPEIAEKGDKVFLNMIEKMEFPRPYEYDTIEIMQDWSVDQNAAKRGTTDIGYLHMLDTRERAKYDD